MSSGRERLYAWDDKSLEWYVNAVEYGSFHRIVAEKMLKVLPEKPTVCDVGCGTGALALCLAEHCGNITAVDLNRKPIDYLKSTVRERGIENIRPICADFEFVENPREKYDAVVFCLAGGISHFYEKAEKWGNNLFFIENATNRRSFSMSGKTGKETYFMDDIKFLSDREEDFTADFFTAPFGQVFETREEAWNFMRHYDRDEPSDNIWHYLEEHLLEINSGKFRYYLPCDKKLVMLSIKIN